MQGFFREDPVASFILTQATAERSERYISSFERTDLGVPLEVEFEETLSSGADGDNIYRNVSAQGVVYNIKIWSINGASFSTVPLTAGTTLKLETGRVKSLCKWTYYSTLDTMQLKICIVVRSYYFILLKHYVRRELHLTIILLYTAQPPLSLDC